MINIEELKPLNPDKIILFGSYAYGTPNEDSDFVEMDTMFSRRIFNEGIKLL